MMITRKLNFKNKEIFDKFIESYEIEIDDNDDIDDMSFFDLTPTHTPRKITQDNLNNKEEDITKTFNNCKNEIKNEFIVKNEYLEEDMDDDRDCFIIW